MIIQYKDVGNHVHSNVDALRAFARAVQFNPIINENFHQIGALAADNPAKYRAAHEAIQFALGADTLSADTDLENGAVVECLMLKDAFLIDAIGAVGATKLVEAVGGVPASLQNEELLIALEGCNLDGFKTLIEAGMKPMAPVAP